MVCFWASMGAKTGRSGPPPPPKSARGRRGRYLWKTAPAGTFPKAIIPAPVGLFWGSNCHPKWRLEGAAGEKREGEGDRKSVV